MLFNSFWKKKIDPDFGKLPYGGEHGYAAAVESKEGGYYPINLYHCY